MGMGEFLQIGLVQLLISSGLTDICCLQSTISYRDNKLRCPYSSNDKPFKVCKMQVDETDGTNQHKETSEKRTPSRRRVLKKNSSLASSRAHSNDSSSSDEYSTTTPTRPTKPVSPKRDRNAFSISFPLPHDTGQPPTPVGNHQQIEFQRSFSYPMFTKNLPISNCCQDDRTMAFSSEHNKICKKSDLRRPSKNIVDSFVTRVSDSSSIEVLKECDCPRRKMGHVRSRSDVPRVVRFEPIADVPSCMSASTCKDLEACFRRRSLLEEGGQSVAPKTECFFPRPLKGQSLTSFLSSEDFQTCAELDRENAHFYIAEALISAIEQIKCNQLLQKAEEEEEESDEEIQHLKQRIRIRRRERQHEKASQKVPVLLSDGRTDTTTSQSASSPMSSTYTDASDFSSSSSEDVDELELSDTSNLNTIQEKGLSLSLASLYSDADVKRMNHTRSPVSPRDNPNFGSWELGRENLTAEAVALSLLRKFSEKQLPKASDLEWLVSEQDAPQRLLPLPDSWPVSPDDVEEQISLQRTRLRGTLDWAPPRAQIIFNIHPKPNRKLSLGKQQYRCSGCGYRIDRGYIDRFRYCNYLGKYFCQCCHNKSLAVIPGHVLQKWDFRKYEVSIFSRDLLDRMHSDPLFNVADINAALYKKSRSLDLLRICRMQISHLVDYVSTCKDAARLKKDLDSLPDHWIRDPHVYSIQDLLLVKKGTLGESLHKLCHSCVQHVLHCTLCYGRGFICEICRNANSIIFPFQLDKAIQCQGCSSCFHRSCFDPRKCPRCARIELRKRKQSEKLFSSDEEA